MKGYLLDTHVFLWWLVDSPKLSKKYRQIISDPDNLVVISVASAWEILLKQKTHPDFNLEVDIEEIFGDSAFEKVAIELAHVSFLDKLSDIHNDPFDRILIAQAVQEELQLLTVDEKIRQYELDNLSII